MAGSDPNIRVLYEFNQPVSYRQEHLFLLNLIKLKLKYKKLLFVSVCTFNKMYNSQKGCIININILFTHRHACARDMEISCCCRRTKKLFLALWLVTVKPGFNVSWKTLQAALKHGIIKWLTSGEKKTIAYTTWHQKRKKRQHDTFLKLGLFLKLTKQYAELK